MPPTPADPAGPPLDGAPTLPTGIVGPGELLALFRSRSPLTRSDVMALTGLSRSTVNQRIDLLIDGGLLVERDPDVIPGRGRGARPARSRSTSTKASSWSATSARRRCARRSATSAARSSPTFR